MLFSLGWDLPSNVGGLNSDFVSCLILGRGRGGSWNSLHILPHDFIHSSQSFFPEFLYSPPPQEDAEPGTVLEGIRFGHLTLPYISIHSTNKPRRKPLSFAFLPDACFHDLGIVTIDKHRMCHPPQVPLHAAISCLDVFFLVCLGLKPLCIDHNTHLTLLSSSKFFVISVPGLCMSQQHVMASCIKILKAPCKDAMAESQNFTWLEHRTSSCL